MTTTTTHTETIASRKLSDERAALSIILLARELRAERVWLDGRYCVPDVRYIPLVEEKKILASRLPRGLSIDAKLICLALLDQIYAE